MKTAVVWKTKVEALHGTILSVPNSSLYAEGIKYMCTHSCPQAHHTFTISKHKHERLLLPALRGWADGGAERDCGTRG